MHGISYLFEGLAKPLVVVMVLLIGASVLAADKGDGRVGLSGIACEGFTSNPQINRLWCTYHPSRIWHLPITEVIPGLKGD